MAKGIPAKLVEVSAAMPNIEVKTAAISCFFMWSVVPFVRFSAQVEVLADSQSGWHL